MDAHTSVREAERIHDELRDRLNAAHPGLLDRYPTSEQIRLFDEVAESHGYRHVPDPVRQWVDEIQAEAGEVALEDYNRLLLATLILNRGQRRCAVRLPASVEDLIDEAHLRILSKLDKVPLRFHRHANDRFAKDLAVCRLKLLPSGAEYVDPSGGIPRRVVAQGGIGQLERAFRFFVLGRRRFRNWLDGHWDLRLGREFHAEGYDRFYVRIAEILELNPELQGLKGAAWWNDPVVSRISPSLAFLSRVPVENGAALFRVGEEEIATRDALLNSRERRTAHKAGRYRPVVYLLAWPREDVIAWARRRPH